MPNSGLKNQIVIAGWGAVQCALDHLEMVSTVGYCFQKWFVLALPLVRGENHLFQGYAFRPAHLLQKRMIWAKLYLHKYSSLKGALSGMPLREIIIIFFGAVVSPKTSLANGAMLRSIHPYERGRPLD